MSCFVSRRKRVIVLFGCSELIGYALENILQAKYSLSSGEIAVEPELSGGWNFTDELAADFSDNDTGRNKILHLVEEHGVTFSACLKDSGLLLLEGKGFCVIVADEWNILAEVFC